MILSKKEIAKKLIEIGFDVTTKGFEYWIYILNNIEHFVYCNTTDIIKTTAKNLNVSYKNIDRTLRYSLKTDKIKKYYGYSGKITITSFIKLYYVYEVIK